MEDEIPESTNLLVEQVMRFTKEIHRVKAAITKEVPDRAAYALLYPLTGHDKRASDLAEITHSDPSTVSRHISHLIENDLVKRIPDQQDGRATLLSITEKGLGLCETLRARRGTIIAKSLSDWPDEDIQQLTSLLARLNDGMEANYHDVVAEFGSVIDEAAAASTKETASKETA